MQIAAKLTISGLGLLAIAAVCVLLDEVAPAPGIWDRVAYALMSVGLALATGGLVLLCAGFVFGAELP